MSNGKLTLYGYGTVRQMRPHWMLAEMDLNYEFNAIHPRSGQTTTPEFLKLNPRHKVPVLRHDNFVICESAAIIQYITEAFPAPPNVFVPRTHAERGRLNEWCFFLMSEIDAQSLYVIRRHTTFKDVYGEAPEAVNAAFEYFKDQFYPIAPRITENGPCLFGDRVSAADVLLTTVIDWAIEYGIHLPDYVLEYHGRMLARPAYQRAVMRAQCPATVLI